MLLLHEIFIIYRSTVLVSTLILSFIWQSNSISSIVMVAYSLHTAIVSFVLYTYYMIVTIFLLFIGKVLPILTFLLSWNFFSVLLKAIHKSSLSIYSWICIEYKKSNIYKLTSKHPIDNENTHVSHLNELRSKTLPFCQSVGECILFLFHCRHVYWHYLLSLKNNYRKDFFYSYLIIPVDVMYQLWMEKFVYSIGYGRVYEKSGGLCYWLWNFYFIVKFKILNFWKQKLMQTKSLFVIVFKF